MYTDVEDICSRRAASDSYLHVVVTRKMLSDQKHFQVLEQMVVRSGGVGCVVLALCCSTTTLALMQHCEHNCFSGSGGAGRCLTIPPIVRILLPESTLCFSTWKGSWPGSISSVTTACRLGPHASSSIRRRIPR
ncbi:hypothetical protein AVEN_62944-1 [Araneus ventricosus]|uniref:Uncharacterized protein n=1 Tax=Araneus ventricosus TaxID=182803 RepID=A0A4Y2NY28_ARAVE|nr:hypothetical protein AVEN_62944-1 [Araneus ventricosus]